MIDPEPAWLATFITIPKVSTDIWATNFANWVEPHVVSAELTGVIAASDPFTFNKAVFETALKLLGPESTAIAGIQGFADAWETAILASTLVVSAGDSLGAPSPPTIWSVVAASIIDPPSILLGKAKILELVSSAKVPDASDSDFPKIFRAAFLLLTGTVTGLDSQLPPPAGPGPQPLVASSVPLI